MKYLPSLRDMSFAASGACGTWIDSDMPKAIFFGIIGIIFIVAHVLTRHRNES
jgi:hypothetical protein